MWPNEKSSEIYETGAQKSQFTQSSYRPSTLAAQDEPKECQALKPTLHACQFISSRQQKGTQQLHNQSSQVRKDWYGAGGWFGRVGIR